MKSILKTILFSIMGMSIAFISNGQSFTTDVKSIYPTDGWNGGSFTFGSNINSSLWQFVNRIESGSLNHLQLWRRNNSTWTRFMSVHPTSGNFALGDFAPNEYRLALPGIGISRNNSSSLSFFPTTGNWHHVANDGGNIRFSLGGTPNSNNPTQTNRGTSSNYLTINNNGQVGIGTNNPTNDFEARAIYGNAHLMTGNNSLGQIRINGALNYGVYPFAVAPNTNSTNLNTSGYGFSIGANMVSPIVWMYGGGNFNNAFQVRSVGWNDANLATSSLAFQVRTDGKVTIGTECFPVHTSGEVYSLAVNGRVLCTGLRVRTKPNADCNGWGDFVFENDYNLPTLEATEAYIQQNKHLPGIPSAKEVHENGYDVEEMLRLQMIKIEELTLHMIELKKENENLKKLLLK